MFNQCVFLLLTDGNGRTGFRPGRVVALGSESVDVLLQTADAASICPHQPIALHYESNQQLYRQQSTVMAIEDMGGLVLLKLQYVGQRIPADRRETIRIPVAGQGLVATCAHERTCEVQEFSARGLSLLTGGPLGIGNEVALAVTVDGAEHRGMVAVRHQEQLANGQWRLGLECLGDDACALVGALAALRRRIEDGHLQQLAVWK